ncbi:putative iron-sulfur assembly protein IscA-like 1, mitochondrial-like [Capsicum annuum]|uniref:uncharacterized protein LOC107872703 n=1 Tax=Capsicum annuum TaxID=4072 RepID=UPI0007BF7348|nr:uncharacterized protein LOC107872703 [Capsicum annuum]KAF3631160.1 putative iron-sulfur assembly protein IscA-like 1, mitochondrial-like [Capsicum annuum]KAF3651672.1 putative iron-sulfur assembly protein IscA-like 1, mitochondrial-like [Capsicum annuum]
MSLQHDHDYQQTLTNDEEHIENSPEGFSYYDPPESFWLSKDSERDWFDQNAAMQRKTSMKFAFSGKANNKNPKMISHNNQNPSLFSIPRARKSISTDPRVNKGAKQKSRFTRSRSEPGRKTLKQVLSEPGSPKVSCTGRVRRSKSKKEGRTIRTGFWKKVRAALKIGSGEKQVVVNVRSAEPDMPGSGSGSALLKRSTTRRWSES